MCTNILRYFFSRLRWLVCLVRSGPESVKVGLTSVDYEPPKSLQPLQLSGRPLSDRSEKPPVKRRAARPSIARSPKG